MSKRQKKSGTFKRARPKGKGKGFKSIGGDLGGMRCVRALAVARHNRLMERVANAAERRTDGKGTNWVKRGRLHAERRERVVYLTDCELEVCSRLDCLTQLDARALMARITERLDPSEPHYDGDMADFARDCAEYVCELRGVVYNDNTAGASAADMSELTERLEAMPDPVELEEQCMSTLGCVAQAVCTGCTQCAEHCVLSGCLGDENPDGTRGPQ